MESMHNRIEFSIERILDSIPLFYGLCEIFHCSLTNLYVSLSIPRFSWFPKQYVRGELMGGLDILKETAAEGSLAEDWDIADILRDSQAAEDVTELPNDDEEMNDAADSNLEARLKKLINRNPVMLFMKGLPSAPQCGFSRQIVEILDNTSVPYDSFNIFEDEEVRQGLKDYSDWPTYPQLYVKGELIGGLDIVRELLDAGELDETLSEAFGE